MGDEQTPGTVTRRRRKGPVEVEIELDIPKNIAYLQLTGTLDSPTILAALDTAVADPRYPDGMARLWDFTAADLSLLDASTIRSMAMHSAKFPAGIRDVKVALVAGTNLEYGLSRMFEAFSESADATVAAFKSITAAEDWLRDGAP